MRQMAGPYAWVAVALALLAALSLYLIFGRSDDIQINSGFLLLGLVAGALVSLVVEVAKRPIQARDLARALHVELAEFVARCCFDFESPWQEFLDENRKTTGMDQFRLSKFLPGVPTIYESSASQVALLKGIAPQALVQFYYRVSAWRRDAANMAAALQKIETHRLDEILSTVPTLDPAEARFLSQRLMQTLKPGLNALAALGSMIDDPERIEDAAIAGHDTISRPGKTPTETSLRKRIELSLSQHS